jgi:hypothetical protein
MKRRNKLGWLQNRGFCSALGAAWKVPTYCPCGVRRTGGMTLSWAFVRNLRTWLAMVREKAQVEDPRGRKYQCTNPGSHCSIVARKRSNVRGVKGAGHPRRAGVNGRPEELLGLAEAGRLPRGDTSRMNREVHVRICGGLGVKFPGSTRRHKPPNAAEWATRRW